MAGRPECDAGMYARSFFDLQFQFAETVSRLSGMPLTRALLEYTNFYIRFGLGRDFDPDHPRWNEYLAGLHGTTDARGWTYHYYVTRSPEFSPSVVATFGCFAYARLRDDRIRLHFRNAERDGPSPLSTGRQRHRIAELAALFAQIERTERPRVRVIGASWLYNIEAYRRLFPPAYLATARVIGQRFRHMPLWGQFVDRHGEVKPHLAAELLERLGRQSSLDGLDRCFPFQVLALDAPASVFNDFYGADSRREREALDVEG